MNLEMLEKFVLDNVLDSEGNFDLVFTESKPNTNANEVFVPFHEALMKPETKEIKVSQAQFPIESLLKAIVDNDMVSGMFVVKIGRYTNIELRHLYSDIDLYVDGNLQSELDFINENVVDTEGFTFPCTCPDCGKVATERNFEVAEGAVNVYYSISCGHCGYHETDYESTNSPDYDDAYIDVDYENACSLSSSYSSISHGCGLSPVYWTQYKHLLLNNSGVLSWFNTIYQDWNEDMNAIDAIAFIKSEFLRCNFKAKVDRLVARAINEL